MLTRLALSVAFSSLRDLGLVLRQDEEWVSRLRRQCELSLPSFPGYYVSPQSLNGLVN